MNSFSMWKCVKDINTGKWRQIPLKRQVRKLPGDNILDIELGIVTKPADKYCSWHKTKQDALLELKTKIDAEGDKNG